MCGRFTLNVSPKEMEDYLAEYYDIHDASFDFPLPRYNIAPGQPVLSVLNDGKQNRVGPLRWGFVPHFAKDEKTAFQMINAKAETISIKPSFKESFKNKRCIILADGFYEWKRNEGEKIPMRIKLKHDSIFAMAGIWSRYIREDGSKLFTCSIITTSPNELMTSIHDRMPVILTQEATKIWLDPAVKDSQRLNKLLNPYAHFDMEAYPVSNLVNHAKHDLPDCIVPLA
jgi:putative SOS response-associated peptidase YedK